MEQQPPVTHTHTSPPLDVRVRQAVEEIDRQENPRFPFLVASNVTKEEARQLETRGIRFIFEDGRLYVRRVSGSKHAGGIGEVGDLFRDYQRANALPRNVIRRLGDARLYDAAGIGYRDPDEQLRDFRQGGDGQATVVFEIMAGQDWHQAVAASQFYFRNGTGEMLICTLMFARQFSASETLTVMSMSLQMSTR